MLRGKETAGAVLSREAPQPISAELVTIRCAGSRITRDTSDGPGSGRPPGPGEDVAEVAMPGEFPNQGEHSCSPLLFWA